VDLQELLKTVQEFASQMTSSEGGGANLERLNSTEYAASFSSTYDMRDASSEPVSPRPMEDPDKALREMEDMEGLASWSVSGLTPGHPSQDEKRQATSERRSTDAQSKRAARVDRAAQRKEGRDKKMDLSDARAQGTKWPESDSIQNLSSIGDGMRDYHTRLMDVLMTMQALLFDGQAKLNEIQARFNRMR
jgi:hypothetical protein